MQESDEARQILAIMRKRLRDHGFGRFDAHAFAMIDGETAAQHVDDPAATLRRYLEIVGELLAMVGENGFRSIKTELAGYLGLAVDRLRIELDLEPQLRFLPRGTPAARELAGIGAADMLLKDIGLVLAYLEALDGPAPGAEDEEKGPTP